tara:strand:- start:11847 stop:12065 length:219 start_codon:yes stop_codon:yes gene_type:complete
MNTNQSKPERITRFIIALFLLPAPIIFGISEFAIVQASVGAILLFNAISGICAIYGIFGVKTCIVNDQNDDK